jgi:hypothetical protein
MTFAELLGKISDLRDEWAQKSNATTDRDELTAICEQYIADMDDLIFQASGNHPPPPPPRIRP